MIRELLVIVLSLLAYFVLIKPCVIYIKAVRAFGLNGVIFIFKPRYTSIQLYDKMSQKDGDSMKFLREEVAKKPQAKLLIVAFFLYSFIYVLDTTIIRSLTNEHIHSIKKKPFMFFDHLSKGLLFSSEETWKRSRLLLSNLFHFDILRSRENIMNRVVERAIGDLEGKSVNLFDFGLEISGEITLDSFLGERFGEIKFGDKRALKEIREIIDQLLEKTIQPFWIVRLGVTGMNSPPDWLLTKEEVTLRQRILRFKDITREFLQQQLNLFKTNHPVSSNFIETYFKQNPDGECIEEMIDQIFIFLVAGQDTTGMLIEASLLYLSENPEFQKQILQQYTSNPENIHKNRFLNNFINEVLRMRGPTRNSFIREVQKPFTVSGFTFERGYLPTVGFGLVMMNPKHFDDPETFNPERWNKPLQNQLAFTPFLSGPHNCIGQHMALMETRITLVKILLKYHVIRTGGEDRIALVSLLYKMKNHQLVQFLKR